MNTVGNTEVVYAFVAYSSFPVRLYALKFPPSYLLLTLVCCRLQADTLASLS